jgi:hypothetical protein
MFYVFRTSMYSRGYVGEVRLYRSCTGHDLRSDPLTVVMAWGCRILIRA